MPIPNLSHRVIIFSVVWICCVAASLFFFRQLGDVRQKQKALPWVALLFGLLFLALSWYLGLPPEALTLEVPLVAVIGYLNVRAIRFCPACGAYNVSQGFYRVLHCRRCGTSLKKTPL